MRPEGVCQTRTPGFELFEVPALGLLAAVVVAQRTMATFADVPIELGKHLVCALPRTLPPLENRSE